MPNNLSSDEYGIYYKGPNLTIVSDLSKPLYIWFFAGNIFEDNHLQHPTDCDARYNLKKHMETIDPEIHIRSHGGSIDLKGRFTLRKSIKGSLKDGIDKCMEYIYTFSRSSTNTTNKKLICAQINLAEDGSYSLCVYSEEKPNECQNIEMTFRYTDIVITAAPKEED
jgi:hypothetical protein